MRRESFKIRKLIRKWNRKTGRFHIDIRYKTRTKITPRTIGVAEAFGLGVNKYREHVIYDDVTIKLNPRDVFLSPGRAAPERACYSEPWRRIWATRP